MATFIVLITETQQGENQIGQSVDRAESFRNRAAELGVTVQGLYWTLGSYDGVVVFDAADDETAASLLYSLNSKGSVRTQTLRAFDAEQTRSILAKALS